MSASSGTSREGGSASVGVWEPAQPTGAKFLFGDGLPNLTFNESLSTGRLVRSVTLANPAGKEIREETVGDYFKYSGTVEFMESLARASSGGFLELSL